MIELAGVTLLRWYWLAPLPLIALLVVAFSRQTSALAGWDRATDPALLAALKRLGRVVPGGGGKRWLLPAATAALISLALTGPARETRDGPSFRNLDGLVLVVDLSRSVAEGGGLSQALTAARLVADRAGSRPVALVVFGGDAYLASTFTTDAAALGTTIAVLDGDTVPEAGSRPWRGLSLARRTLAEAGILVGDVVLVSDGGGLEAAAVAEAEALAAAGARVSVLVAPGAAGPAPRDAAAQVSIEALARVGGGLTADVRDPLDFAEALGRQPASRIARAGLEVLFWTDYGRALLILALFPALALFRRSA